MKEERMSEKKSDDGSSGGCCGCFAVPVFVLFMWALVFGVTVGGRHYGISGCSTKNGLEFAP